jgi:hypothetical protein
MTIPDKPRSSKQKYRLTKKAASYWRSTPKEKEEMNKNFQRQYQQGIFDPEEARSSP